MPLGCSVPIHAVTQHSNGTTSQLTSISTLKLTYSHAHSLTHSRHSYVLVTSQHTQLSSLNPPFDTEICITPTNTQATSPALHTSIFKHNINIAIRPPDPLASDIAESCIPDMRAPPPSTCVAALPQPRSDFQSHKEMRPNGALEARRHTRPEYSRRVKSFGFRIPSRPSYTKAPLIFLASPCVKTIHPMRQ